MVGSARTFLEVWGVGGPELVALDGDRVTIGRADQADVSLDADRQVSRAHAVLQRYPGGWTVRDLGSANGTLVNGEVIHGERRLHSGDEVRVGSSRLVFRDDPDHTEPTAAARPKPPALTRRERDVLVALCRPLAAGDLFTEPAGVDAIAAELVVSAPAVKQHLANLYRKFNIDDTSGRRARLANLAVGTGAVTLADLRAPGG